MPDYLSGCDLPDEIARWPEFPLSLSGNKAMPLTYFAGDSGWLLYGRQLNKARLAAYQHRLGDALFVARAWRVEDYQVIRVAGSLTPDACQLAHEAGFDVAPADNIPQLTTPGLLLMDMDSTAIQQECIDEIASRAGCGEQVAAITAQAMRGELDFVASLRQRVAALRGTDVAVLQQVREVLRLTPGLTELVRHLQALKWQVAIASGGFTFFSDMLRDRLQLTAVAANQLEIRHGQLTGELVGPVIDACYKAEMLQQLAQQYGIAAPQTVAIGDGANDLLMLKAAALGIAYHAKPAVNQQAQIGIRHADLMGVLCILSGAAH